MRNKNFIVIFTLLAIIVAPVTAVFPAVAPRVALAATNTLTLSVVSAADGTTPVGNFKYIINIDNTGTTTQRSPADGCNPNAAGYPGSCKWVSVAGRANNSPIYTQGDQSDFGPGITLPNGRYLISVLADGYKIDGAHFTMPLDNSPVVVQMQPYDLPDATVRAFVFEDNAPTNSAPDAPVEPGLAGFVGHIKDYIDEVTTDIYGNPLCTRYVGEDPVTFHIDPSDLVDGAPVPISGTGGRCVSDANGMLAIPHLGPNRYALSVTPPDGSDWIQTTTLEGNHDWDAWVMEGATGLDTEFVVAGEPFPATFFGYVRPTNTMAAGSGTVKGTALAVSAYIPATGGIGGELGLLGAKPKDKNPIETLYVSLSDINNGDQTVYVGQFDCNAACDPVNFSIPGVPDGDYFIGLWDEPQDYIFNEQNVSVRNGEVVDLGSISMLGWWTTIEGHVFADENENGKMDNGEVGIPNFFISMRTRENSVMDRGTVAVTTDANGYYWMESAYPMTQWLVEEAYADGFHTTGITYQADNQPDETTILGAGVDVNVHPVIGLGGRLDWGVKAYAPGTNGGIVGTVSYDTTRNELNPQYAAIEDWQPSIAGLTVNLYAPVDCPYDVDGNPTAPCDAQGFYQLEADGSYTRGALLNQYTSETWERPSGCVARNVNGDPLIHGTDENALPLAADAPCLEAPLMGVQFGPMAGDVGTPDENFGASVDGNYGFGDGCFGPGGFDPDTGACVTGDFSSLLSNMDYLVQVEIPNDALGRPMYKVTREEDINIANGDSFIPQVPPPSCAGALHTVDVADGNDNHPAVVGAGYDVNDLPVGVTVPASTPTDNPTFVEIGGSVYEGQQKPLCDTKLVRLSDRKSIAPGFNLFTDVPLPGRFWGLLVDDLNFSSDPQSLGYGEKLGIAFAPVGIYDYTNRLITTVESDYNGLFDVLLPSTNRISCPTPSGVCANLYRFVGNDPGVPGRLNLNYTPQYRTIAAEFEAFPGLTIPADLAPTQVAVGVQIPGSQTLSPVSCTLEAGTPQLYAINKPYIYNNEITSSGPTFTLSGAGFGATQGAGSVRLDNTAMPIVSWSNTQIQFRLPTSGIGPNPYRLSVRANNGRSTVNGLTFHVINSSSGGGGGAYNPTLFIVSDTASNPDTTHAPGRWFKPTIYTDGNPSHAIQNAIEAASGLQKALIVIYPNTPQSDRVNPRGAYYENLVIHSPVKLQGVGPGSPDGSVRGSIVDGSAFGGDTALADDWRTLIAGLFVIDTNTGEPVPLFVGNPNVSDGQVIYLLALSTTQFGSAYTAAIDGLDIRGGDQQGFPGNLNAIFGGFPGPLGAVNAETQGGAIFANAYIRNLQITNNVIQHDGGTYGAIRIGTPNLAAPFTNNENDSLRVANNRILANGGTNLAGAIGLFNGADGYEIAGNDFCGNFSAEYGGAISHFGLSPNGNIHDNRIYFNRSYDEGAGIMIAGELPVDPGANYNTANGAKGSGAVNIFNNLIQANLADDDGGGLRFLMAGNFPMNVYNNMIVNNVSTHEGGGVALDDAPNVRFYNNTVMKNMTTATAITSDGQPAPAGLSTGQNSAQLQPTLPAGSPAFSNPLLFNNIFWDNRAGTKGINTVTGIGGIGDATPINDWDMGVFGFAAGSLTPTNSIIQQNAGTYPYTTSPTNSAANPAVIDATLEIPLTFTSWRTNINFNGAIMVTAGLPPTLMGNYHLSACPGSPACNLGAASKAVPAYQQPPSPSLAAPTFDIDNQARPALGGFDSGADEVGGTTADLSITKTDGLTSINQGGTATYSVVVTNGGPNTASAATVTDNFPASLTVNSWTCTASAGSSCVVGGSGNNRTATVTLLNGGSATLTANTTLASNATGSLANTATVAAAGGTTDPNTANNSATDTDTIVVPLPTLGLLDDFNRPNANTLNNGTNWSQSVVAGAAAIRVNAQQAFALLLGQAIWNNPTSGFGSKQGAAFAFANTTLNNAALILKATGGSATTPSSFIRVRYSTGGGGQVIVESTTNSGGSYTTRGAFPALFASGNTLTAVANADGSVDVWQNSTYLGRSAAVAAFAGNGRIGMQLPTNARVDNFSGGTLP